MAVVFTPSLTTVKEALKEVSDYYGIDIGKDVFIKYFDEYVQVKTNSALGWVTYHMYFDENGKLFKWKRK